MMERQGRPPASDAEVWLARELAFLDGVERRIRRRAAWARRSLWITFGLLAVSVGCSIWLFAISAGSGN